MPTDTERPTRSGPLLAGAAAVAGAAIGFGLYLLARRRRIDRGALAQALLTPDAVLNARIKHGLAAQGHANEVLWTNGLRTKLQRFRAAKKAAESAPGKALGYFVRLRGDGGESFCKRIKYCKKKYELKRQADLLRQVSEEKVFGVKEAGEWIRDNAPDAWEAALIAAEELAELAADGLVVPIIARGIKYGLDDICPCCAPCEGSGRIDDAPCPQCGGTGSRHPFPLPRRTPPPAPPSPPPPPASPA